MFFANPPPVDRMRLNHFLKVEKPTGRMLIDLENRLDRFNQLIESEEPFFENAPEEEEINLIAGVMSDNQETNPIERGVSALLAFHNRNSAAMEEVVEEVPLEEGRLNIFSQVRLPDAVKKLVGSKDLERFNASLLNKAIVKDKVEFFERVMGKSGSQANTVTNEIVKDMLTATDYPPSVDGLLQDASFVTAMAQELSEYVGSLQNKSEDGATT